MLVQCAWAAKRAKRSYYSAQFHRLRSRRGPQKAICAVAASILTAIYHMLKSGLPHRDLGADYFDRRSLEAKAKRLVTHSPSLALRHNSNPSPKQLDVSIMLHCRGFLFGAGGGEAISI